MLSGKLWLCEFLRAEIIEASGQVGIYGGDDGPLVRAKSTVAKRVATALRCTYLDTGAMYRSIALASQWAKVNPTDAEALTHLARNTRIQFSPLTEDGVQRVKLDDTDVTAGHRPPKSLN